MNAELPAARFETWTPTMARDTLLIQKQFGPMANRGYREHLTERYAADMKGGRWRLNGEPIVFNGARLLDGQHRLAAIAKSGVTMILLTVRGVGSDAMPTLNTGLSRTPGDTLRGTLPELVGGYYNVVSAAARITFLYLSYKDITTDIDKHPTRVQLVETVQQNPGLVDSAKWSAKSTRQSQWARLKVVVAWHYLCGRKFPAERDTFFNDLIHGIDLGADRPVRLLRERFIQERGSRAKLPTNVWCAFIAKTWNAELLGRPLKLLRYGRNEPFPVLYGDEDAPQ